MADTDLVIEGQLNELVAAIAAQNKAASLIREIRDSRIMATAAIGGSSTAYSSVGAGPTGTGTATAVALGYSSKYAAFRKVDILVTTASATAVAGLRANAFVARGVDGYPNSGWDGTMRCGPATGLANANHRFFCGLRGSASAPTDVAPSSQASMVGFGWDAGDTNVHLFHNDASGTATKTNLGVARPTTDRSTLYRFDFTCEPAATTIDWTLTELITGAGIGSGTISSADIPPATTALCPMIYASAGGTSSVVGVTFVDWYFESRRSA